MEVVVKKKETKDKMIMIKKTKMIKKMKKLKLSEVEVDDIEGSSMVVVINRG